MSVVEAALKSVSDAWATVKRTPRRQALFQVLSFLSILASALTLWKGLSVATNSESPIVVVLSGSMEPALFRGDLIFLNMEDSPIEVGEIVVFKLRGQEVPIVHRVIKVHTPSDGGKALLLTKGDNNGMDDRGLYNRGQLWIERGDVIGRARAYVPYAGAVTILMNDYPWLKGVALAGLAVFVIVSRE